jgi:hypothetical protein
MSKLPKGNKGLRAKLRKEKLISAIEIRRAMKEASDAIDSLTQELISLKRILISERAQVIYYSDKYLAFLQRECLDLVAQNFLDLDESLQEPYVKRAIKELSDAQGIVPHDKDAQEAQQQAATVAKKLILPN